MVAGFGVEEDGEAGAADDTRAVFLRTDSGLFLVLGGMIAGSHKEFGVTTGQRVKKGDRRSARSRSRRPPR